jgi:cytochrome P450
MHALTPRVNGAAPPEIPLADVNLSSLEFWGLDDDVRDGTFATLRREAPISFWPPIHYEGFARGEGHWALTKLDDVFFASRHPDIFSSAGGITISDQTPEIAEYFGSMIVLDDPRHQRLRSIVSRAFTPKVVARIETSVRERAHRLVASLIADHPDGQADLVSELAGPLPLQVICDMMGIPEEDHQRIFHWTNVILGFGDPDLTTDFDDFLKVSAEIGAYATALAEDRRSNHHDDLTSSLVDAEVDGAMRSATACWRCLAFPTSGKSGGPTSTRWHPARSRKSCGGPRRWCTCGAR